MPSHILNFSLPSKNEIGYGSAVLILLALMGLMAHQSLAGHVTISIVAVSTIVFIIKCVPKMSQLFRSEKAERIVYAYLALQIIGMLIFYIA